MKEGKRGIVYIPDRLVSKWDKIKNKSALVQAALEASGEETDEIKDIGSLIGTIKKMMGILEVKVQNFELQHQIHRIDKENEAKRLRNINVDPETKLRKGPRPRKGEKFT